MTDDLDAGDGAVPQAPPETGGVLAPPEPSPPASGPGERPRSRHHHHVHTRTLVAGAIAFIAVGVLVGASLVSTITTPSPTTTPSSTGSSSSVSPGAPANSAALATATAPSLVDIDVTDAYEAVQGAGTGMVMTSNGLVLTNNHVIEGETSVQVRDVGNGRTYGATVVGYDRTADVAVLRLTGASGLTTAVFGASGRVGVGDGVVAVGNGEGAGG